MNELLSQRQKRKKIKKHKWEQTFSKFAALEIHRFATQIRIFPFIPTAVLDPWPDARTTLPHFVLHYAFKQPMDSGWRSCFHLLPRELVVSQNTCRL